MPFCLQSVLGAEPGSLQLPKAGDHGLRILDSRLIELNLVNIKQRDSTDLANWDWVNDAGTFVQPDMSNVQVLVDDQPYEITDVGFKRRPVYAEHHNWNLRIKNSLYILLNNPIDDGQKVQVTHDGASWLENMDFAAEADPLRYNPAIHVNQEGYLPSRPKKAIVGYYIGNLGEMTITSMGFALVDAQSSETVYQGSMTERKDEGYKYTPRPYQKVYQADFSSITTPGKYFLTVPGMGASMPFDIGEGIGMTFARTYALGLYHQSSGIENALPFTRFTHGVDHTDPAKVPIDESEEFEYTWNVVADYATRINSNNPEQIAPALTTPSAQLFPFVNEGPVDVSGGSFEAGNYSKVTWNSAQIVHSLMFAVDSLPGVAELDNLGLPESDDGVSDVLQRAKWEADFLLKMQDADGGFYYAVEPQFRKYENDVLPDEGDPQIVWPKNSSSTAASVAALAQCASSPLFKQRYPEAAQEYLHAAELGWTLLIDAIDTHGKDGVYQKLQHFGDLFTDKDELIWAATEMYLATGDPQYHTKLRSWFPDPTDRETFRWGWWKMFGAYGNAIRSYAFAERNGRMQEGELLDQDFLASCIEVITDWGNDNLKWSQDNAYGTSFPNPTKRVLGAGWYFSTEQAFDMLVAHQLNPDPDYVDAILLNLNYEAGANPVNVSYISGLGWKRQHQIVDQYSIIDRRTMPRSGIPIGNIRNGFSSESNYGSALTKLTFPSESAESAPYPYYDRWSDTWNVTTESSTTNIARSFAVTTWLAAQTSLADQPWRSTHAEIIAPETTTRGQPVTVTLEIADNNPEEARIVWEARGQEPAFGDLDYTFTPENNSSYWIEAEIQWPDGRRAFAVTSLSTSQKTNPEYSWKNYEEITATGDVYTSELDWINIMHKPYLFSYQLTQWLFVRENWVTDSGTWVYLTKKPNPPDSADSNFGDWLGYPLENNAGDVNTGNWLGWVYAPSAPFVYSYHLNHWMYINHNATSNRGIWIYVYR